jgi:basic amino acid/polyamine antiporter, APA family
VAKNKKLKKELGLLHVFAIATGAMVSSGIFLLPGLAFDKTGPSVILSYLFAGVFALAGLLSVAELSTAMPKAGGDYYFITRGMGPAVGSVSGLLTWFALSLKSAFALVGMSAFIALFIDIPFEIAGVSLAIFFTFLNLIGTKHAGRFQVVFVVILVGLMIYFVLAGLPNIVLENYRPFKFKGTGGIFFTAGFVFVSYGGLLKVSSIAEEVENPGRNIPLGMILSLFVAILAYSLMVFVTVGTLPADELRTSLTPIVDSASIFLSKPGVILLGLAAILAFLSTANAGIMSASRYLLALGRDGLAPTFLSKINKKFHTPHYAVIITGFFISLSLFLKLDILVEAASLVLIIGYILSCLCVIIMRESDVQNYRPIFKTPIYPIPQIVGIIGFIYLVLEMGKGAYLVILTLISFSFAIFWFYGRKRNFQEYALMHLIEKITSKKLVTGTLESELKHVIRERDNWNIDRFDKLVFNSAVIDIEEDIEIEELFRKISDTMAPRVNTDSNTLFEMFQEREKFCSAAIIPGLAIPHIVLDKEDHSFDMAIIRVQKGVVFPCSENKVPVKVIFAIIGSLDERTFHLQTLANIAQVAQSKDLFKKWDDAKNEQGLKDVILLSDRIRHSQE